MEQGNRNQQFKDLYSCFVQNIDTLSEIVENVENTIKKILLISIIQIHVSTKKRGTKTGDHINRQYI